MFTGAIHRYGITAEDIVMEGAAKLLAAGTCHDDLLRPELLWWAAHKAGLDMVRASAHRPQQVPLQAGDGSLRRDIPACGEVARPDQLAWEATCWRLVARRLQQRLAGHRNYGGARGEATAHSTLAAWRLASRAAADSRVRRAFAERPRLAVWAEVRAVAPEQFEGGTVDRFPPRSQAAARRRAFRLVGRAVGLLETAHREIQAQACDDDRDEPAGST